MGDKNRNKSNCLENFDAVETAFKTSRQERCRRSRADGVEDRRGTMKGGLLSKTGDRRFEKLPRQFLDMNRNKSGCLENNDTEICPFKTTLSKKDCWAKQYNRKWRVHDVEGKGKMKGSLFANTRK